MTSFRIRPRFRMAVDLSAEEVKALFQERIAAPDSPCEAAFFPEHIILRFALSDQHFWSPRLELALEEQESGGTLIRGLYGPSPQIWTFFMIAYGAIGTLALFIAIIGFSRLSLGMTAHILWVLLVLGGGALFLYLMSQTGQKLGADQTFTLHHFFEDVVRRKTAIS